MILSLMQGERHLKETLSDFMPELVEQDFDTQMKQLKVSDRSKEKLTKMMLEKEIKLIKRKMKIVLMTEVPSQ